MKQPITQIAVTAFTLALAASGHVLAQQKTTGGGAGGGAEIIIEEQPARIQVEQDAPDVIVDQPTPDVTITKPRPEVEVNQAQPDVKLRDAVPRVSVDDEGQPDITVRQTEQSDAQVGEQQQREDTRVTRERDVRVREAQEPPPVVAGQQPADLDAGPGGLMSRTAEEIEDMKIVNRTGEEIGEVDRVMRETGSNRTYAVTSVGGFLGIGATDIAIPLDEMNLRGDTLVAPITAGEDRLEERYTFDDARFTKVEDSAVLGGSGGTTPAMAGAGQPLPSFSILDEDGDGYITQQEAEASPDLNQAWPRVDANNDRRIDEAEFSAFEAGTRAE